MLSIGLLRTSRVGQRNVIARLTTYIRCIFQRHFRFGIVVCLVFSETYTKMSHLSQRALPTWLSRSCPCLGEESYVHCTNGVGRRSHPVDNRVLPMWRLSYYKSIEELCYILCFKSAMQGLLTPIINSFSILYLI